MFCTATGDTRPVKERVNVSSSWSPSEVERRLCPSPASDLLEMDPVTAVSSSKSPRSKSPGLPSLLALSSPSPALRGCRLQQLEDYEANHSKLPAQSPRNDFSLFESPPHVKLTSSNTNGVRTPTSQTKSKL